MPTKTKVIRAILLAMSVATLSACTIQRTFFVIIPEEKVVGIYPPSNNRFTIPFNRADSVYQVIEKASDEAMKRVIYKFKN